MDTLSYKTVSVGKTAAQKEWVIVDATDQVLGRLASKVAKILRGKYKPCFTPNADCGDNVIIINADKVKLTGNKWSDKSICHTQVILADKERLHLQNLCKKVNQNCS